MQKPEAAALEAAAPEAAEQEAALRASMVLLKTDIDTANGPKSFYQGPGPKPDPKTQKSIKRQLRIKWKSSMFPCGNGSFDKLAPSWAGKSHKKQKWPRNFHFQPRLRGPSPWSVNAEEFMKKIGMKDEWGSWEWNAELDHCPS